MLICLFCIFIQPFNTINLVYNGGNNIYKCTQEGILVYLPLYKAGMTYSESKKCPNDVPMLKDWSISQELLIGIK